MDTHPLVSIVIPTKNEEANIERCLKSLLSQTYPKSKIEIIVVDNFSTDRTVSLAKKYAQKVLVKGPERSAQRNYGAKQAKGTYLIFLDADMTFSAGVVTAVIKLLQKENTIVSIPEIGKGKNFWEKMLILERSCYLLEKEVHGARGFSRDFFKKLGGYDEKLYAGEDWDLTLRAKKLGAILETTKGHPLYHYEKVTSIKEHFKKEQYYISNIKRFAKKHPTEFKKLASLRFRGWLFLKNYREFLKHPILALALIVYKLYIRMII